VLPLVLQYQELVEEVILTAMGNKNVFFFDSKFFTYEPEIIVFNVFSYQDTGLKTLSLLARHKDVGDDAQNYIVHIRDAPYR
jgi:hypothetical protein